MGLHRRALVQGQIQLSELHASEAIALSTGWPGSMPSGRPLPNYRLQTLDDCRAFYTQHKRWFLRWGTTENHGHPCYPLMRRPGDHSIPWVIAEFDPQLAEKMEHEANGESKD